METEKRTCLLLAALLSLSGVLPAAATDYQAADYLPLAVGNSWTYEHQYWDDGDVDLFNYDPYWDQWRDPDEPKLYPEFTIDHIPRLNDGGKRPSLGGSRSETGAVVLF